MTVDKELAKLKRMANKLIKKQDEKGIHLSNIALSAITRVGYAESMKDLSWLAHRTFIEVCSENKIK